MAERTTIAEVVQIGVEATPGTPVAANRRLQSLSIEASPQIETQLWRPRGQKYNTLAIAGKEFVEGNLSGKATYDEMIYPLSSVVDTGTVAVVGTTGQQWTFLSDPLSPDAPKTYTVEQGSAVRTHRYPYGLVTDLSISISRDAVDISGSTLGMAIEDGITLTPAPTLIPIIPILPQDFCVYVNDTFGAIGTTKLTRLVNAEFTLGGRFSPFWPIDCALPSFGGHVETEPDLTLSMRLEADATGMQFLTQVRAGATKYVRLQATGDVIPGSSPATNYGFTIDMAVKVTGTDGFSDEDGLYAVEWNFVGVTDTDIPGGAEFELVNTTAAL